LVTINKYELFLTAIAVTRTGLRPYRCDRCE